MKFGISPLDKACEASQRTSRRRQRQRCHRSERFRPAWPLGRSARGWYFRRRSRPGTPGQGGAWASVRGGWRWGLGWQPGRRLRSGPACEHRRSGFKRESVELRYPSPPTRQVLSLRDRHVVSAPCEVARRRQRLVPRQSQLWDSRGPTNNVGRVGRHGRNSNRRFRHGSGR
jgi:hypothetical protein